MSQKGFASAHVYKHSLLSKYAESHVKPYTHKMLGNCHGWLKTCPIMSYF